MTRLSVTPPATGSPAAHQWLPCSRASGFSAIPSHQVRLAVRTGGPVRWPISTVAYGSEKSSSPVSASRWMRVPVLRRGRRCAGVVRGRIHIRVLGPETGGPGGGGGGRRTARARSCRARRRGPRPGARQRRNLRSRGKSDKMQGNDRQDMVTRYWLLVTGN